MEVLDNTRRTGGLLAAARTAAGLELTDVARETRVPLRHLKALEADSHEDLPALPYAIGFVKAFARAVGLDPETIAAQFRSETSKSAHVPTSLTLEPLDERRLPSRGLVLASVGVVIAIIAGLSAWGSGMFDRPAPVASVAEAPAAAPVAATTPAPPPAATADTAAAPADGAVPAATVATTPPITASGSVVLTAKDDVWVKIYDKASKAAVKIGVLKTGESFTVPTDPPGLVLWTGKAGALDVTIGGKPIPPLGGPVETVRDVSLAPADLVARANHTAPPVAAGAAPAADPAAAPAGPRPIATIPARRPVPGDLAAPPAATPSTTPGV